MSDEPVAEFVGVSTNPDGSRNFSRALRVVNKLTTETSSKSLDKVLDKGTINGVTEQDLVGLSKRLALYAGEPSGRRGQIITFSSAHSMSPEQSLELVRSYAKEKVKVTENGLLLHYHQIPIDKLEIAAGDRALLSTDTQKALGRKTGGTSRPDVVQMTRDKYDRDGKLIRAGLGSANLMSDKMVTLVLKPEVMDLPGYDCTGEYPDLPSIPLKPEYIQTVLVSNQSNIQRTELALKACDIKTTVQTREDWANSLKVGQGGVTLGRK